MGGDAPQAFLQEHASNHDLLLGQLSPFIKNIWILAEKGTVIRTPGVDLEGGPTALQEPYLTVLLLLHKIPS